MSSQRFKNKVALVTGASRGIGRSIAIGLAGEGAEVVVNFSRNEAAAREVQETICALNGGGTTVIQASVDDEDQVHAMFQRIKKDLGRLDILVNNAGVVDDGHLAVMSLSKWERVIGVDLTGAFLCSREALKLMAAQRSGAIVNIASVSGVIGPAGQANYAAAKAGVIGFTRSLAREAAPYGIRANVVVPGFVETEMVRGVPKAHLDRVVGQTPLGRLGRPEEIAGAALFLASDEASYITAQSLIVDGGMV